MIERRAARVLLLDPDGEVLLFRGADPGNPAAGSWWFTPGGGLEGDESFHEAAFREVEEETGLRLTQLEGPVHERSIEFEIEGVSFLQHERFFVAHVDRFDISDAGWTPLEKRAFEESRWWSTGAMTETTETIHPPRLWEIIGGL